MKSQRIFQLNVSRLETSWKFRGQGTTANCTSEAQKYFEKAGKN